MLKRTRVKPRNGQASEAITAAKAEARFGPVRAGEFLINEM